MLEHTKKLTESANDAFHQETDEADMQNVSTQAAETGLDVAHHAKAAVHGLCAYCVSICTPISQRLAVHYRWQKERLASILDAK